MPPLDPIVSEFASTEEEEAYDRWFRAKVEKAMTSTKPTLSHEEAMARVRAAVERSRRAHASVG